MFTINCNRLLMLIMTMLPLCIYAQHETHDWKPIDGIEPQPLLAQSLRLKEALTFLGSALSKEDEQSLGLLQTSKPDAGTSMRIQHLLDAYCIAGVEINPEARVSVVNGPAKPVLVQSGWKTFLVKVHNLAGINAMLEVESRNAAPLFHISSNGSRAKSENHISAGQVADRFLELSIYRNRPLKPNLSGFALEYVVLQVYCKERGSREASLGFHVGQGTQDIGFRNAISILFNSKPSVKVIFRVEDENAKPAMASFIIKDGVERTLSDSVIDHSSVNYRLWLASNEYQVQSKVLTGIYPLPSRRLAATDEYPDFFFQPQVYRKNGEHIFLAPGKYQVTYTRGPEYVSQTTELVVPENIDSLESVFKLKRWVQMTKFGWFSADHHIHAAGCSHYESPEEGVPPADMLRQVQGEDLNMAAVLTWGPGWYHQKQYFTAEVSALSTSQNVMRYDVEVSGFPSSHAGHLVLLHLKEDDYPGTTEIEQWPSWTAPVLQWAKKQNALTGYAHSGWGLEPSVPTDDLPNNVIPKMDGIGANEYVVTVTQGLIDFFSAGDTPAPWELNMWYHTLNAGFRTRLSGETDFPCIFDERVGIARSYFKNEGTLSFEKYIDALKKGNSYVSDGKSHIVDFKVNQEEMGVNESELKLAKPGAVQVSARTVAWLPEKQDEQGRDIAGRPLWESPYWHIERARIGQTRKVKVELLFNGKPVDAVEMSADGNWKDLKFNYDVKQSGWMALRIYPSSHTNPVFIVVNGKSISIPESKAWCRKAVDQCWKMKKENIRTEEQAAAELMYNKARAVYDK